MVHSKSVLAEQIQTNRHRILAAACVDPSDRSAVEEALDRFQHWLAGNPRLESPGFLILGVPAAIRHLQDLQSTLSAAEPEVFDGDTSTGVDICLTFSEFALEEAERYANARAVPLEAPSGTEGGRMGGIFENAPVGIFHSTLAGRFLDLNQTAARMFGYASPAEMASQVTDIPNQLFVHPEDRADIVRGAMESGSFVCRETQYRRKDETVFVANVYLRVIQSTDGGIDYLEGLIEDTTERRQSESALRESEANYRRLLQTLQEGIWVIDADGLTTYVNATIASMLGYTQEEMLGRHLFSFMDESAVRQARENLRRRQLGVSEQHDFAFLAKDGRNVETLVATSPLIGDDGRYLGAIAGIIDITQRKQAEEARDLAARLILLAGSPGDIHQHMADLTTALQNWSGCEAVGIRLREGDDFPYFETRGFPSAFVLAETHLCQYDPSGDVRRDSVGNPVLECMCGNVLCGRFDPKKPFFTANGSFWTNSTTTLLASTTEADRQSRTRNRCNGEGYESVALVPLRLGQQVLGLLQFNDHRPNRFNPDLIARFERMAGSLAIAMSRRYAEEALRESEETYRSLFENMLNGFAYCQMHFDEDGQPFDFTYLSVNSAFETLTGLTDVIGRKVTEIIPGIRESDPELFDIYGRVARSGVPERFETFVDALQMWFWISVYSPKRGYFVAVFDVITERKRAEAALRESEFFFKESQRAAFIGSYKTDFTIGYWESSEVLNQIFGIEPTEHRSVQEWLDIVHPDDRDMMAVYLHDEVMGKGKQFNKEYRIIRQCDGEVRYVHGLGEIASDAAGNVISMIGTIQDITERVRAAEALREAAEAKDRFLALLSHELRNPLATIANAATVLKTVESNEPRLVRARDAIERASESQARLLEDLLDVSRITHGRVVLRLDRVHLDTLAATVVRSLAAHAAAKGLELSVDTEPDVVVNGDETRLEQILFNLVINAVKYTDSGSVWVTVHRDGSEVVLTVRDTGVGIDADMLPHVFDMFSQADETLAHAGGGLGLGLSLVKSFVELHGGVVTAESAGSGRGSTFTVRLPAGSASDLLDLKAPPVEKRDAVPAGLRVLLVDDNVDARETMRDILELDRCIVFEAGDGYEALEAAAMEKPDVVLLDIGLPGMDGYEVSRELRARPEMAGTRIVAVTGYGQDSDREKAIDAGFDAHLTKPVDLDLLRDALQGPPHVQTGE